MISVNEIQTQESTPLIAAVEQCPIPAAKIIPTQQRWYQTYSVTNGYAKDNGEKPPSKYQVGDEILAIEAVQNQLEDVRPKIFDKKTNTWVLLDSGSCVSCEPKQPGDVIDPHFRLRSVNGGTIATFGTKVIKIQIGRKQYEIEAVIADIPQGIFGWDLFKKYRLGFEWGEFGDLFITDNKASIKSPLKFQQLSSSEINRVDSAEFYEEPVFAKPSAEEVYFMTECMKNLSQQSSPLIEPTAFSDTTEGQVNSMVINPEDSSPYCDDIPLLRKKI